MLVGLEEGVADDDLVSVGVNDGVRVGVLEGVYVGVNVGVVVGVVVGDVVGLIVVVDVVIDSPGITCTSSGTAARLGDVQEGGAVRGGNTIGSGSGQIQGLGINTRTPLISLCGSVRIASVVK